MVGLRSSPGSREAHDRDSPPARQGVGPQADIGGRSLNNFSEPYVPDPASSSSAATGAGRPAPAIPTPLDVVYICGAHRSGATVLGALLAARPEVFFWGEAYRYPRPMFWPGNMVWPKDPTRGCSCGVPADQCPFWTAVRAELEQRAPFLENLERGQRTYESWSALPTRLGSALRHDPALDAHVQRMVEFLRVIAARTEARVLAESSYSAMRGSLYRRAELAGGRVRFVHLVRDGRNFLASELGVLWDPERPARWVRSRTVIVARWVVYNLAAILIGVRDPRSYLRVRYEDLVLRPAETLAKIGAFLDLDLSDVARRVAAREAIPMRHIAAGNRARLRGSVVLRGDLAGLPQLPRSTSALFWALGGWLALLLGYRPGTPVR